MTGDMMQNNPAVNTKQVKVNTNEPIVNVKKEKSKKNKLEIKDRQNYANIDSLFKDNAVKTNQKGNKGIKQKRKAVTSDSTLVKVKTVQKEKKTPAPLKEEKFEDNNIIYKTE